MPDNIEVMLRCQRIVEHGLAIAEDFPRLAAQYESMPSVHVNPSLCNTSFLFSLNVLNVKRYDRSGRLEFSASAPLVRILPSESANGSERRPTRTNVAIQAIMQNKLNSGATVASASPASSSDVTHENGSGDDTQVG